MQAMSVEPEGGSGGGRRHASASGPSGAPARRHATPTSAGRVLRRPLLGADVVALCVSFLAPEFAFGSFRPRDIPMLLLIVPVWVLVAVWPPPLPHRQP
jgi:hypothetical protein